jgi:single-strand DNA-binding protein
VRDWESATSRGTAVEIDAEAIGHDLRWGTTTFVKDTRAASQKAAGSAAASAPEGTWAAPGLGIDADAEEAYPADEAPEPPSIVGSHDEGLAQAADAERPF